MSTLIYVDETKAKGYLLAAVMGKSGDMDPMRTELGSLILPGQRTLHMKTESDSRRRQIISTIIKNFDEHDLHAVLYNAGRSGPELQRRERCMAAIVNDALTQAPAKVVFDLDESLQSWDCQRMIEITRLAASGDQVTYEHQTRFSELLLVVPDAIAWCWARGGDWRTRVHPIVDQVRVV